MVLFSTECYLIVGESGHLKDISLRSNKKKRNNLSLSSTRLATRLHFWMQQTNCASGNTLIAWDENCKIVEMTSSKRQSENQCEENENKYLIVKKNKKHEIGELF